MSDQPERSTLDQITKRAVRTFWMDGLWDFVAAGAFLIIGTWGMYYVQYVAFRESTWPFLRELGRDSIWLGPLVLVLLLAVYFMIARLIVKALKRRWIAPLTGYVEHRYFLTADPRVYLWYFILYLSGIGLLYGLFVLTKGGAHVMSVPFIMSPAAILWALGRMYGIRRYQWISVIGLASTILLELLITWPASYQYSPESFLNVRPEWGGPALPCFIWAILLVVSGTIGFINVRRGRYDA
ncbi:MAG: hypothetical protein GTO18_17100 [Anaerolineales bacterium]|nr:hypothetical protein [Anaerolineales bacterium]